MTIINFDDIIGKKFKSKKKQNILVGDGIGSLIKMALPFVKSIAPKVLGTVGLSSIGALTSYAINKKIKLLLSDLAKIKLKKLINL